MLHLLQEVYEQHKWNWSALETGLLLCLSLSLTVLYSPPFAIIIRFWAARDTLETQQLEDLLTLCMAGRADRRTG